MQEHSQTEAAIHKLKRSFEQLDSDECLQKELELEKKLHALLGKYNQSLRGVITMTDLEAVNVIEVGLKSNPP